MVNPPGLLISAPNSGAGKTMVMLGLLRAFRNREINVQPFKNGPDYIDPAFHLAASGQSSYNLDSWAMSPALLQKLGNFAREADFVLTEGSMGLFDGVARKGATGHGSSAEIANFFGWPVVLVLDVSGQAQSAAATALGFANYNSHARLAGVILNRVASARHERLTRLGMESVGIKVFGALPRREDLKIPERHLGLIQASEHPNLEIAIADYASFLSEHVDLDALQLSGSSAVMPFSKSKAIAPPPGQHIAIARDDAFSFIYPHLLAHWRSAGTEISFFSPLADETPERYADVIWLPGGYPELHAGRLASAQSCFRAIRKHSETRPVHGECGGYMVLGEHLIDKDGEVHKMLGLLGLCTTFAKRQFHLGYRKAKAFTTSPLFKKNTNWHGHEFHYSSIIEQPDKSLFSVKDAEGNMVAETGSIREKVSGTFFHMIAEAE